MLQHLSLYGLLLQHLSVLYLYHCYNICLYMDYSYTTSLSKVYGLQLQHLSVLYVWTTATTSIFTVYGLLLHLSLHIRPTVTVLLHLSVYGLKYCCYIYLYKYYCYNICLIYCLLLHQLSGIGLLIQLVNKLLQQCYCVYFALVIAQATIYISGGVAQMVERSLSMREVPGSIPGASISFTLQSKKFKYLLI